MTTPSTAPSSASQASAANGEALPEWPDIKQYGVRGGVSIRPLPTDRGAALVSWGVSDLQEELMYRSALAAAWEARARLAVRIANEMLNHCARCGGDGLLYIRIGSDDSVACPHCAHHRAALAAIGPLPAVLT